MGSSSTLSPAFAAAFLARSGPAGVVTFADFMELALYHPELGYYRQARNRVGYGQGTDFYTASTSGAVFGEMVAASCVSLLGGEARARECAFVEIGAESEGGILAGITHPFASAQTIRVGDPIRLTGSCVVFSNELFDAQPVRRFVRRGASWNELGVILRENTLHEIELDPVSNVSALSDDQVLEMIEEADLTAHYSLEEARDILHIGNRQ